jgi:hypothetical protein
MFLALFTDPARNMDVYDNTTMMYTGQAKRKTFDKTMSSEKTTLYVFERCMRFGWKFLGNARVCSGAQPRTDTHPPVWQLALKPLIPGEEEEEDYTSFSSTHYRTKQEILDRMGLVPKYKNLALGIVPLYD